MKPATPSIVMPGLVPGIHDLLRLENFPRLEKVVDARAKPEHDGMVRIAVDTTTPEPTP